MNMNKINAILKTLKSMGMRMTKEELYHNIKMNGRGYAEYINSKLTHAKKINLLLTQKDVDAIRNNAVEFEELRPMSFIDFDENHYQTVAFREVNDLSTVDNSQQNEKPTFLIETHENCDSSLKDSQNTNELWQKILKDPKNYEALLGRRKSMDFLLKLGDNNDNNSITQEEIQEMKQDFFDTIADCKDLWREMWKSNFSVNGLLDEFFFLNDKDADLIYDACNDEEKALFNDYFDKLRLIENIILEYQESFSLLQNLDEVSGKLLISLLSSRDRKQFLNIFKDKKSIFKFIKNISKVDSGKLEKDYYVYDYIKSCKKMLKKECLKVSDVEFFTNVSKKVTDGLKKFVLPEQSLNAIYKETLSTSADNEESLNKVFDDKDTGYRMPNNFFEYLDSLKKNTRLEWDNVVDRSQKFVKSFQKLSLVERFKIRDHYEAIAHPIKRKLVYGGLIAGSILSITGAFKHANSNSFVPNEPKVESTQNNDVVKNLFSNIKVDEPEAKKVLYNNVLGDFETKSDIQAKRKDLHEMREKVTKLQSIISEKSEIQQSTSEDIMFGDVVNLENENVKSYADIYSATSKQNGLKSYYGVSEERVVESIFFSKGNEVINTYTYEEYQNALNNGYTLEGYTLVNQNSLGEDNLVIEGRYSKDSVKLVRK